MKFFWQEDKPNHWTLRVEPFAKVMEVERVNDDNIARYRCLGHTHDALWTTLEMVQQAGKLWLILILEKLNKELQSELETIKSV